MILNKHIHLHHNGNCKSEKFPLLLSSGPRQNYSQGTDEGVMALRSPIDVKCLVHHLVGGDGWLEKGGNNGDGVDVDLFDENTIDGITRKSKKKIRYLMSAAEKVLSRARDRSLGVVTTRGSGFSGNGGELKKRKRGFPSGVDVRVSVSDVRVQGTGSLANQEEGDDEDGHDFSGKSATSLVDWLSEPMQQISEPELPTITVEPPKSDSTNAKEIFARIKAKQIDKKVQGKKMDDSEDGGDDLEDGYIAL